MDRQVQKLLKARKKKKQQHISWEVVPGNLSFSPGKTSPINVLKVPVKVY